MQDYQYYYEFTKEEIQQLANTPYKEALHTKVQKAHDLAAKLLSVDFMQQDSERINKVLKAKKFNLTLLDELKDSHDRT